MNQDVWRRLSAADGDLGRHWETLVEEARGLRALDRIAKAHGREVARFASLQAELRSRAKERFPDGRIRFWTSKGLEQATPAAVADYRAQRFAAAAPDAPLVWDACAGVGADALALMRTMPLVLATDLDEATLRCAAQNLRAEALRGKGSRDFAVLVADALRPPLDEATLARSYVLLDPDRRPPRPGSTALTREGNPERWDPPLSGAMELAGRSRGSSLKLPPGLDPAELEGRSGSAEHFEWVSLGGEMKELTLWTGELACGPAGRRDVLRTATALTAGPSTPLAPAHYSGEPNPGAMPSPLDPAGIEPGQYLVELDPSLWQADLAGPFAALWGLRPIGAETRGMFLVASGEPEVSPLMRAWPILDGCAADRRGVRSMLRPRGIGPLTVKKRQHPKTSLELEKELRGGGTEPGTLAVFRVPNPGSGPRKGRSLALLLGEEL